MENDYSNYDMFDQLIDNNKKAKYWTAFWMVILCLMAGALLWLAFTLSEKNKTITEQGRIIQTSSLDLEIKSRIIDSLTENCNTSKAALIKGFDSTITQTQNTISTIVKTEPGSQNMQITPSQIVELKQANSSIQKARTKLYKVTSDINKENTKLFVQYNNNQSANAVNLFLENLKTKTSYILAPPEFIDKTFPTVIKFYNYSNTGEELLLKKLIAEMFGINPKDILVKHEDNPKIKATIEVWISTRIPEINIRQMQKNIPVQQLQKPKQ